LWALCPSDTAPIKKVKADSFSRTNTGGNKVLGKGSLLSIFSKKKVDVNSPDITENENKKRDLKGIWKTIMTVICVTLAAFQLYAAGSGLVDDVYVVSIHLSFIILIIYLLYPATSRSPKNAPTPVDIVLGLLAFWCAIYVAVFAEKINLQMGIPTMPDLIFGGILIVLVLEAARRSIGKALPIVALVFMAFAFFGRSIPGAFRHAGFAPKQIIKLLYLTDIVT
jgi:TRAP-type uncharacterized transport system fused permease subunit